MRVHHGKTRADRKRNGLKWTAFGGTLSGCGLWENLKNGSGLKLGVNSASIHMILNDNCNSKLGCII